METKRLRHPVLSRTISAPASAVPIMARSGWYVVDEMAETGQSDEQPAPPDTQPAVQATGAQGDRSEGRAAPVRGRPRRRRDEPTETSEE